MLAFAILLAGAGLSSAQGPSIVPTVAPPHEPVVLYTAEYRIRVVPIVGGLSHPWGMAFRKNGDILVTERDRGALRIVRDGQLLDQDIQGVPEVFIGARTAGFLEADRRAAARAVADRTLLEDDVAAIIALAEDSDVLERSTSVP